MALCSGKDNEKTVAGEAGTAAAFQRCLSASNSKQCFPMCRDIVTTFGRVLGSMLNDSNQGRVLLCICLLQAPGAISSESRESFRAMSAF